MITAVFLFKGGCVTERYLTVCDLSNGEYSEKKSRFLATLLPCENESEIAETIAEYHSRYWDARHCVYAAVFKDGTLRFSDDGEPHGTAGKPILEILQHSGLTNVLVVVVRYFGGVLLGTGGLCRAYSAAAKAAIDAAEVVEMRPAVLYSMTCDYADHARLISEFAAVGATVVSSDFSEQVQLSVSVEKEYAVLLENHILEKFSARIAPTVQEEKYAAFFSEKIEEFAFFCLIIMVEDKKEETGCHLFVKSVNSGSGKCCLPARR